MTTAGRIQPRTQVAWIGALAALAALTPAAIAADGPTSRERDLRDQAPRSRPQLEQPPRASAAFQGQTAVTSDAYYDNEAALAPDLRTIGLSTDASGFFTVRIGLDTNSLVDGDAVATYVDTDGNSGTGSALWNGADLVVLISGAIGTDYVGVSRWNGTSWSATSVPSLSSYATGGSDEVWSAALGDLGIAPGTTVKLRFGAIYSGIYDVYSDFHPEAGAAPVSFFVGSDAPPTPAAAPPPGAAAGAPTGGAPTGGAPTAPGPDIGVAPDRPLAIASMSVSKASSRIRLRIRWVGGAGAVAWIARLSTRVGGKTVTREISGFGAPGPRSVVKTALVPRSWKGRPVTVRVEVFDGDRTLTRSSRITLR